MADNKKYVIRMVDCNWYVRSYYNGSSDGHTDFVTNEVDCVEFTSSSGKALELSENDVIQLFRSLSRNGWNVTIKGV